MNKSSSFYSEAYYEKARKQAYKKKPIYRQKHKELIDQQHELQIQFYYHNTSKKCNMISYFELLNEVYQSMKEQVVKKNEDYNICVEQFISNMKKRIAYFHQNLMCRRYLTKEQYMKLGLRSAEDLYNYWASQDLIKMQEEHPQQTKREETIQTVQTCNLCPIFVEQFQYNFERSLNLIIKSCEYWEQLNGHQKISKYRWHIEQNLKVLQHQFQSKCQYAQNKKSKHNTQRR